MIKLAQLDKLKAVFFDLDGTLVDSAIDIYLSMNAALAELGRPLVTDDQVRIWVGRGAAQLCHCVLTHQQQVVTPEEQQQLLQVFMRHYEKNVCVGSKIYDGVGEFIAACQQRNLYMACITNKPYQPAHDLLQALNLYSPFQLLLGGDSLTHRKPHPESLLHALHYFDVKRHEALMIGDSRNDVEAAHAAGMPCYALTYGYNHGEPIELCKPDLILDSLNQLL